MNGVLVIDKPQDFTSFDVVAKLRGILKERRLGHGGTLDPMATGVLPVFIGTATRAIDLIPRDRKRYRAGIQLGLKTDTGDMTGNVIAQSDVRLTRTSFETAMRAFLGKTSQIPPMMSAVKIDGKRLYALARQGITVERRPREIEIFEIKLLAFDGDINRVAIDVACSKGTYIRTLAEDIAEAAGGLGTLFSLRRTESAGFNEASARTLTEVEALAHEDRIAEVVLPVETLFEELERVELDAQLTRLFLNGVAFETARTGVGMAGMVSVWQKDVFLGLAHDDSGHFKKIRQFYFEQPVE